MDTDENPAPSQIEKLELLMLLRRAMFADMGLCLSGYGSFWEISEMEVAG